MLYFYHTVSKKACMLLQSQPNFSNAKTSCILQLYSCKDKVMEYQTQQQYALNNCMLSHIKIAPFWSLILVAAQEKRSSN